MASGAGDGGGAGQPALTLLDDVCWYGVPVVGERTRALFASLAASAADGVSDGRLIDEIWGAAEPANPTKALQVVVSRARAATCADAVVRIPNGYRLGTPDTDLARVLRGHDEAVRAESAGNWTAIIAAAEPLLALTVEDDEGGELGRLRQRARGLQSSARTMVGRALSVLGRHTEALSHLEEGDEADAILVALLRSEAAVRGVPAALQRYDGIREQLADRLGIDPAPELQALHAELLMRDSPVREGLHFETNDLIGRDEDISALTGTIRTSRVTSIVGTGGLGKTRLAHLMGRLAEQPVVHFVELAGVTSPDGVAVEVGDVLGMRESVTGRLTSGSRRGDLLDRIVDQIGTVPALLILDNCEHLVEAVADLVQQLITRTPELRVLTTTRAPLGLAAERVYQLGQLSSDDAAELFRERATAARAGVRLDPVEVRSLVERLDGLPLAVELAAAKVRAMSVSEIHRRLADRFTLLRGGAREAPERHQTLLAVIDWSWNLLEEEHRVALRRLSIFRDGFTLAGADAVLEGDALVPLSALVEQSLVTVTESVAGLRYRLLETVREFGQLQLVGAGDDHETARRMLAWGLDFSRRAEADLFGPHQIEVMTQIRSEEGNLVDLLRRCLREHDAESVVVLMACLSDFWTIEGSHLKVVGLAHDVEEVVVDVEINDDLLPLFRLLLTSIVFNSMIFSGAVTAQALARLQTLEVGTGGTRSEAHAQVMLAARQGMSEGNTDALDRLCEDPMPRVRQGALQWVSRFHENSGDLDRARACAITSRDLVDGRDGPWSDALAGSQLAGLAIQDGDVGEALVFASEALPTMEALGATDDVAQLKAVLAVAAMKQRRFDDAERILDEIEAIDGGLGAFGGAVMVLCGRPELDLAMGRVEHGLSGYRDAVRTLIDRRAPAGGESAGDEPWVLFPKAAAVSAHVRHGRRDDVAAMYRDLVANASNAQAVEDGFVDYPVMGTVVFAVASWELTGDPDPASAARAVRLLVHAEAFGYNRQLPSLSWPEAELLAESVLPGDVARVRGDLAGRKAPELRGQVRDLMDQLRTQ